MGGLFLAAPWLRARDLRASKAFLFGLCLRMRRWQDLVFESAVWPVSAFGRRVRGDGVQGEDKIKQEEVEAKDASVWVGA